MLKKYLLISGKLERLLCVLENSVYWNYLKQQNIIFNTLENLQDPDIRLGKTVLTEQFFYVLEKLF